MAISALIADSDPVTVTWLKAILEREQCKVDAVGTGAAAVRLVAETRPSLIVLEALLPDGDGLDVVRQLRKDERNVGLHIIVLSTLGSAEDIARSMQAGADDYILKRPGADYELIGKVRAISMEPNRDLASRGRLFSFCSAKGGAGTTCVCVNTAYALSRLAPTAEIVVVDMVFPMGTVGQFLGFESDKTVARLTLEPQVEPMVVNKYVSPRLQWGFHILVGANDPQEATLLDVNRVVPLFDTLKKMYDYVFVDFGRALSRISLPIMETSEVILLVLTPDVSTVRGSKLVLDYFRSRGIALDRLFIVNNRTVGRVWTSGEEMERDLGVKLSATVPYTVEYMTLAINAAVPFVVRFPENAASSTFTEIARSLHALGKGAAV